MGGVIKVANDSLDDFAKFVWGRRAARLAVSEEDEINPQELSNLYLRYAYAQIIDPKKLDPSSEIHTERSRSGWPILNYGNAMATSAGEGLFSQGNYEVGEDGITQRLCSGTGTIIKQIIDTAADMVLKALEQKWSSIHIVHNSPELMAFALWKAGTDLNIIVTGYTPSEERQKKYRRILQTCPNTLTTKTNSPLPKGPKA